MSELSYHLADLEPLIREAVESGGEFRLYPRGTSMLPLLRQGVDSVALVRVDGPMKKYDIPLYRRPDGAYVLHRVLKVTDGGLVMCGDNQTVLETGVSPEAVICRVQAIWRGEKRYEMRGAAMRLYAFLWCQMPVRKLCLALRRRLSR